MYKHKINKIFKSLLERYESVGTALIYKSSEYSLSDLKNLNEEISHLKAQWVLAMMEEKDA